MEKTKQRSQRRRRIRKLFTGLTYVVASVFMIYMVLSNAVGVYQQKEGITQQKQEKQTLEKEKSALEKEIQQLNDNDYATRYAREHYVFTRDGERVVIIPSVDK